MVLRPYTVEEFAWQNSGMNDNGSQPQDKLPVAITIYLISRDAPVKTWKKMLHLIQTG